MTRAPRISSLSVAEALAQSDDVEAAAAAYCERAAAVDGDVKAFLGERGRKERITKDAAKLRERREAGETPPLFGVPVAIKDIFGVDGFETGAGSELPTELFAGPEADCVTSLKNAGALVLAKSVTTEFAMMDPGPTRNPHALDHTPGGSSSGSAAAVAAGLVAIAIGSQTTGSVIRPAAFCGVVGFKPSFGRIPTGGMLHCSPSVDHVGAFTADVTSLRTAASVLLSDWRKSEETESRPRLGIPEGPYLAYASEEGTQAFEEQVHRLREQGYEVLRVPALEDFQALAGRHSSLVAREFAEIHGAWFDRHGALYRPCATRLVEDGRKVDDQALERGRASRIELRERFHTKMEEEGVDLWISPPAPGPAPAGLASTGSPAMNLPWTHAGLPTLSLPAGSSADGLPLGLQVSGRFGADERLLHAAEELARAVRG